MCVYKVTTLVSPLLLLCYYSQIKFCVVFLKARIHTQSHVAPDTNIIQAFTHSIRWTNTAMLHVAFSWPVLAMPQFKPIQFRRWQAWYSHHRSLKVPMFSNLIYHISHEEKLELSLQILGPTSRQQNSTTKDGQVITDGKRVALATW